jgi:hypothetical protein
MDVFERIAQERVRQQELLRSGKITFSCSSPIVDDNRKLRVLTEEVGEVAEAIDALENKNDRKRFDHLREELVQVAAVAVAWLEAMEVTGGAAAKGRKP